MLASERGDSNEKEGHKEEYHTQRPTKGDDDTDDSDEDDSENESMDATSEVFLTADMAKKWIDHEVQVMWHQKAQFLWSSGEPEEITVLLASAPKAEGWKDQGLYDKILKKKEELLELEKLLIATPESVDQPNLEEVKELVTVARRDLGKEGFYQTPRMKDFASRALSLEMTTEQLDYMLDYENANRHVNLSTVVMPRGAADQHCWPKAFLALRNNMLKVLEQRTFESLSRKPPIGIQFSYRPPFFEPCYDPHLNKVAFMFNFLFRTKPEDVYDHPLFVFVKEMYDTVAPKLKMRERWRSNVAYFFIRIDDTTIARSILRLLPLVFGSFDNNYNDIKGLAESIVDKLPIHLKIDAIKPLIACMEQEDIPLEGNAEKTQFAPIEVRLIQEVLKQCKRQSWCERAEDFSYMSIENTRTLLNEHELQKYGYHEQANLLLKNLTKAYAFEKRAGNMISDMGPSLDDADTTLQEFRSNSSSSSKKWAFGYLDLPQVAPKSLRAPWPKRFAKEPWRIQAPNSKTWVTGKQRAHSFGVHTIVGYSPEDSVGIKKPILWPADRKEILTHGCPTTVTNRLPEIANYVLKMQDLGSSDMATSTVKDTIQARLMRGQWVQQVAELLNPKPVQGPTLVDFKGRDVQNKEVLEWPKVSTTTWRSLSEEGKDKPWLQIANVNPQIVCATDEEIQAMVDAIDARLDLVEDWRKGMDTLHDILQPAPLMDYLTVNEHTKKIEEFVDFGAPDEDDTIREQIEGMRMGLEDASRFNNDFSSVLDQVLPVKTQVIVQYGKPEAILAVVQQNRFSGYTDAAYLPEIARCCDIDGSFGRLSLLQALCDRYKQLRDFGPVLPEIMYEAVNYLENRFWLREHLSSRSKDGNIPVMPHENLEFLRYICDQQKLRCPERDMVYERCTIAEQILLPLIKNKDKLMSVRQFRDVVQKAQKNGIGHPRIEQMAMQLQEFSPWLTRCHKLEHAFTKQKISMPYDELKSLYSCGYDLSFVKEALEMKKKIDAWYQDATELEKEGHDLSLLNREPKTSAVEVDAFLKASRSKYDLPCHTQLVNLLSTQHDLENQVRGIILDNNLNFAPGNLFKAMNIITSSPMAIDDEKMGLPSACWIAACRTVELFEVKSINSLFLRIPICALRRLQAIAPPKRTEWHDYIDGMILLYDVFLQEAAKSPVAWARLRLAAGLFPLDLLDPLDELQKNLPFNQQVTVVRTNVPGPPGSNMPFTAVQQIELLEEGKSPAEKLVYYPVGHMPTEKPKSQPKAGADKAWRDYLDVITNPEFDAKQVLQFLMSNSGSRAMMYEYQNSTIIFSFVTQTNSSKFC